MPGREGSARSTVSARAAYSPRPGTPPLRIGVALTNLDLPLGDDIQPHATKTFAGGESFPVTLTAFEGEPHPFTWAGHEVHSRHGRVRRAALDVIAAAENGLDVPRHACRALPGLEDWADQPPPGLFFGFPAGDPRGDLCRAGHFNGWTVHIQAPSSGTFELAAPVVRRRTDPTTQTPQQLGVVTVRITVD